MLRNTHLALLMMLQQVLAAGAAWVRAFGVAAAKDVAPEVLPNLTTATELALFLSLLTLGTVPQEQ